MLARNQSDYLQLLHSRLTDANISADKINNVVESFKKVFAVVENREAQNEDREKNLFEALSNFNAIVINQLPTHMATIVMYDLKELVINKNTAPILLEIKRKMISFDVTTNEVMAQKKRELADSLNKVGHRPHQEIESLQKDIDKILKKQSTMLLDFWNDVFKNIRFESQVSYQGFDSVFARTNYLSDYLATNPQVSKIISSTKYQFTLVQDGELRNLLHMLLIKLRNFKITDRTSMSELLATLNKLDIKIREHCGRFGEPSQEQIASCYEALAASLQDLQIQPLHHVANLQDLAALQSTLDLHILKEASLKLMVSHLNNMFDRTFVQEADIREAITAQVKIYGSTLSNAMAALCKDEINEEFISKTKEYETVESYQDQLPPQKFDTIRVMTDLLENNLEADQTIFDAISYRGQNASFSQALKEISVVSEQSPKSFTSLRNLEQNTKHSHVMSISEQASFRYRLARARYTLTVEEKKLLSQATGLDLAAMSPTQKNSSDLTYDQAVNDINQLIEERNQKNEQSVFWRKLFPLRTNHLIAARDYIQYHSERFHRASHPEKRLKAELARSHRGFNKGHSFRETFGAKADSLWGLFGSNRAIKDLDNIHQKRKVAADSLKQEYSDYFSTKKKIIQQEMHETLSSGGRFFTALSTRNDFVLDQFLDPEKKQPNLFIDSAETLHHAKQKQSGFYAQTTNVEALSLLEMMQIIYLDIHDALLIIDRAAKSPTQLARLPNQLTRVGENLETARVASKDLRRLMTAFSRGISAIAESNSETLRILDKLKKSPNITEDLQRELIVLATHRGKIKEPTSQWSVDLIKYVKTNQTYLNIKNVQDQLRKVDPTQYLSVIEKEIGLINRRKQYQINIKEIYSHEKLQRLVNVAKKDVQALAYFTEHTTGVFRPTK